MLVDRVEPPVYQRIAERAAHLRELGMSDRAIGRAIGSSDKTIAKAIASNRCGPDCSVSPSDQVPESRSSGLPPSNHLVEDEVRRGQEGGEAPDDDARGAQAEPEPEHVPGPAGQRRTVR